MSELQAVFYDRNFTAAIGMGGKYVVSQLDWALPGGSKSATLVYENEDVENEVEQALDALRYGVDLCDENGMIVWNGFIHEVEIVRGKVGVKIGLDGLANSIAVRYIDLKPSESWSNEDGISDFAEDSESIKQYGKKEWIGFLANGSPDQASAAASTWLKEKGRIEKKVEINRIENEKVIFHCRGWWETLKWIYYQQEGGFAGYLEQGKREQAVGNNLNYVKVAQKFNLPKEMKVASEVWLRVCKTGNPTDEIVVEITNDTSGSPGSTVLASCSISANGLSGAYKWVRFPIGTALIGEERNRWVVVSRTGYQSTINYYNLQVDDGMGYALGDVRTWNGSSWTIRQMDINFAVLEGEETTRQIERIVAYHSNNSGGDAGGQILQGVRICDESGISTVLRRDLRMTCCEEIEALLATGTSDGSKLDAMVDGQRNLVVWKRKEEAEWRIDREGRLWTLAGAPWSAGMDWLGGVAVMELGDSVELRKWREGGD